MAENTTTKKARFSDMTDAQLRTAFHGLLRRPYIGKFDHSMRECDLIEQEARKRGIRL
jgi:hypothetical protein